MRLLRILLLLIPMLCYAKGGGGHGGGGHSGGGHGGAHEYSHVDSDGSRYSGFTAGGRSASNGIVSHSSQDNSSVWMSLGMLLLGLLCYMRQRKQEKLDEEKYK